MKEWTISRAPTPDGEEVRGQMETHAHSEQITAGRSLPRTSRGRHAARAASVAASRSRTAARMQSLPWSSERTVSTFNHTLLSLSLCLYLSVSRPAVDTASLLSLFTLHTIKIT